MIRSFVVVARRACALSSLLVIGACAGATGRAAALAPVEAAWRVTPPAIYKEWWAKTEACSGRRGTLQKVAFYAVDAPPGRIHLGDQRAEAWWVREGNRIYLPKDELLREQLVRHEMLHAITRETHHSSESFVRRCHVASEATWIDSSLAFDPRNPAGR